MKDWADTGEAFDASYAPLCAGTTDALMAALGPSDGRSLVDVGAGTGVLSAAFAAAGWDVTACEPEPSMRAVARRKHPTLRLRDVALPSLPFADAAFEGVVANFVLNHVADPRAGARELARVAADRVAATIWTTSPTWLWREVCERAGLTPSAGERLPPDRDFERSCDGFARMLSDAGWRTPQVVEHTWTWDAETDALWRSAEGGVGGAGQFYRALDVGERSAFRRAFDQVCGERCVDGVVALEHSAAVAVAAAR